MNKTINRTKIICCVTMIAMGIAMILLKQVPVASEIFSNMNNTVVFPALGIVQKIGWNNFSTFGAIFCFVIGTYFAFFYKDSKKEGV